MIHGAVSGKMPSPYFRAPVFTRPEPFPRAFAIIQAAACWCRPVTGFSPNVPI